MIKHVELILQYNKKKLVLVQTGCVLGVLDVLNESSRSMTAICKSQWA